MEVKRLSNGTETWKPPLLPSRPDAIRTEAEIPYIVLGATSKEEAIRGVIGEAPRQYGAGLILKSVRFDEFAEDAVL